MRVLFVSGSLGLGHVGRDLAIARELRRLRPDVTVDWLAGQPATDRLIEAGERTLPECRVFDETGVAEGQSEGYSLNLVRYATMASAGWVRIARTILRVVDEGAYDALVGDETYELVVAFTLVPRLKKVPAAVIYDFFGLDAMTRSPVERAITHVLNRIWAGGHRGKRPRFDVSLFVGEPDDIPDLPLGWWLPGRRRYACRYFDFLGYVLDFDPAELRRRRPELRASLGYDDRPLVVCSVGGTSVGAELLRLCARAYTPLVQSVGAVRMVLICGPRLDPATVDAPPGVEVRGFVPRLREHFAAADAAVVQAGGTTTLELAALRRPFVYVPLEGHVEQNVTIAGRLRRQGAGERRDMASTSPEELADTLVTLLGSTPSWPEIPADGARRAAEIIAARLL